MTGRRQATLAAWRNAIAAVLAALGLAVVLAFPSRPAFVVGCGLAFAAGRYYQQARIAQTARRLLAEHQQRPGPKFAQNRETKNHGEWGD